MTLHATPEQQAIIDAVQQGNSLRITAFAGTGKTTTLAMIGQAYPERKGLYLAYNRAVLADARKRFPKNVTCQTTHSLAYSVCGHAYRMKLRQPLTSMNVAKQLQLTPLKQRYQGEELFASARNMAACAISIVGHYCNSAEESIGPMHLSLYHIHQLIHRYKKQGIKLTFDRQELAAPRSFLACYAKQCLHIAEQLWAAMKALDHRAIGMTHDGYLKLYQLSSPKITGYDFIMLDEAQDANPAMLTIFTQQTDQCIYVGDTHQQIYAWRGSINAMDQVPGEQYYLTQSFRFGQPIADIANRILRQLKEARELIANPAITSQLAPVDLTQPYTRLCRTNAGILTACLAAIQAGKRVACVGGIRQTLLDFQSAYYLWKGMMAQVKSAKIRLYGSWQILTEEASLTRDRELSGIVTFVTEYQDRSLDVIKTIEQAVTTDETQAEVILSTAHKAKGREWAQVCLHHDFEDYRECQGEELNLWYVAVTRASLILDCHGEAMESRSVPPQPQPSTLPDSMDKAIENLALHLAGEKDNTAQQTEAAQAHTIRKLMRKSATQPNRQLRYALSREGLDEARVEELLSEQASDQEKILSLLQTKYAKQLQAGMDYFAKRKLIAKLARLGFAPGEVSQAMAMLIANE